MGYGGALIWTGLARNLKKTFPQKDVVFVYGKNVKDYLLLRTNPDLVIYDNNPDIAHVFSRLSWYFVCPFFKRKEVLVVDLTKKKYHYWTEDSKEKLAYRTDGHAITIACKPFALSDVSLETVLIAKDKEVSKAEALMQTKGLKRKNFICIEPNAKKTFTANKQWPPEYWEKLVHDLLVRLTPHYLIAQIGVAGSSVLPQVIDLTGTTTFRELKPIIEKAALVICNEGGVAHLAAGTKTKTIVIANPSLPLQLMAYPQHTTVAPKDGAHNCGLRAACPICQERLTSITPDEVLKEILAALDII